VVGVEEVEDGEGLGSGEGGGLEDGLEGWFALASHGSCTEAAYLGERAGERVPVET
jgi:hypothetical protein